MSPTEHLRALCDALETMPPVLYEEVMHCLVSAQLAYKGKLDWATRSQASTLVSHAIELSKARGRLR